MMNKQVIKKFEIDEIIEMSTEELVELRDLFVQFNMTGLYLECVQYEIENRRRAENRVCANV